MIKGEGGRRKEKRKKKEPLTFTDGGRRMREHKNEGIKRRKSCHGREGCHQCGCGYAIKERISLQGVSLREMSSRVDKREVLRLRDGR